MDSTTSSHPAIFPTTIETIEIVWGHTSDEWSLLGPIAEPSEVVYFKLTNLIPASGPGPNYQLWRVDPSDDASYVAVDKIFTWNEVRDIYNAPKLKRA